MLNNTKVFIANDDKSPPLTRVLLYSKHSKTLSIRTICCVYYFLFLLLTVLMLLSKAAWTSRPLLVAAAVLAGGVSATTSSSSRFRRPLPEAGVNFGRRLPAITVRW